MGEGASARRLPGVDRTRLRGGRGGLARQAGRVGSALSRRRLTLGMWEAATATGWGAADGAATAVPCGRCSWLGCGSLA